MQCLQFKTIKSVLLYSSTYSSIPLSPPDDKMSLLGNTPVHKNGHDAKNYHLTFPICWLPQLGCTEKTMGHHYQRLHRHQLYPLLPFFNGETSCRKSKSQIQPQNVFGFIKEKSQNALN